MNDKKIIKYKITPEPKPLGEVQIKTLNADLNLGVKSFEFKELKNENKESYQFVKAKYGPLATTDAERNARNQRDHRFKLNPILKERLSVEQEEKRIFDQKINEKIQAIAAEVKSEAIEKGYQEGIKRGFEEAYSQIKSEGNQNLEKLNQVLLEMEKAKEEIYKINEKFLIELIYRISRMVILKELSIDRDYICRLAKELVSRVGTKDNITLKINPDDLDLIETMKNDLKNTFGQMSNLNIESSSHVSRGTCQIETQWNAIDANIDIQLDEIYLALFGKSKMGSEA